MTTISPAERAAKAETLRSEIDALASQIRQRDAAVLAKVIAYTSAGMHREFDGFSGLRDWICACFDFNYAVAGQYARIARLSPKFKALAEAATSGAARIDAVAYAMLALDKRGLRIHARTPYPVPVENPYEPQAVCATPEELIRAYCVHASHAELREAIDRIAAALFDEVAMMDELSQNALAHLEVTERPDGMWDLDGTLTADAGRLLDNYFKTAIAPPRQDEADSDTTLPAQANRNAEALHQLLASHGASAKAPTRHGHTATLSLSCDLETLRGERTDRPPRLEGKPIPVSKARFLACEAAVVPMVFDYDQGEVVELGRTERLPNPALRRKLEAEQPQGCAWRDCDRPVSWTEAHHVAHWADGGATDAENLILLCRFHHGRIHTTGWTIAKTAPGKALITRKGCSDRTPCRRCPACDEAGRSARPEIDLDDCSEVFDVDLEPREWSPDRRRELNEAARWATDRAIEKALAAKAKARERFRAEAAADASAGATVPAKGEPVYGPPPFLTGPQRATAEEGARTSRRSPIPKGERAPQHVRSQMTRPTVPKPTDPRPGIGGRSSSALPSLIA